MQFHEAAEIFPAMCGDEFRAFKEDIRVHGQIEPIIIFEGEIIDGRNRFRACQELGIEPIYKEWEGTGSIYDFVISTNLQRRHLNESQIAMIIAQTVDNRQGERTDLVPQGTKLSQTAAAELFGVSRSTVIRAAAVLKNGVSEVIQAVEDGELSVTEAAEIVKIPRTKQKRMIRKGRLDLKNIAKNLRVKKILKTNKETGKVCVLCHHENGQEISDDEVIVHLTALKAALPKKFHRYLDDMLTEIDEMDYLGELHEAESKILLAIDAGHREKALIKKFTGLAQNLLDAAMANMLEYRIIEPYSQQGKGDKQRGQLKTLFRRFVKIQKYVSPETSAEQAFEEELARRDAREGLIDYTGANNAYA